MFLSTFNCRNRQSFNKLTKIDSGGRWEGKGAKVCFKHSEERRWWLLLSNRLNKKWINHSLNLIIISTLDLSTLVNNKFQSLFLSLSPQFITTIYIDFTLPMTNTKDHHWSKSLLLLLVCLTFIINRLRCVANDKYLLPRGEKKEVLEPQQQPTEL